MVGNRENKTMVRIRTHHFNKKNRNNTIYKQTTKHIMKYYPFFKINGQTVGIEKYDGKQTTFSGDITKCAYCKDDYAGADIICDNVCTDFADTETTIDDTWVEPVPDSEELKRIIDESSAVIFSEGKYKVTDECRGRDFVFADASGVVFAIFKDGMVQINTWSKPVGNVAITAYSNAKHVGDEIESLEKKLAELKEIRGKASGD